MRFLGENTPPISMNALTELEQQIGCVLPEDYRNFLIHHNGGEPEKQVLPVPDCQDEVLVDLFLGIGRPKTDIQDWLKELEDDLKGEFLPIAFDSGGNVLLMDKSDGKIYYWDSARHFSRSSDEENAFWIANSFSDLLGKLKDDLTDAEGTG